jgi:DUF4097 and DUF4098 domain-containing protein YvlB
MKTIPPVCARLTVCAFTTLLLLGRAPAADFESNLEKTFPASPGGKLVVDADRGNVEITTDGGDKVGIVVFRKIKGGKQAEADQLFADHEVAFSEKDGTISVTAKVKAGAQQRWNRGGTQFEVRCQISIPAKFSVEARTAGGNLQLGPALDGPAILRTAAGKVTVKTITGALEAATSGGNVSIEDAGATVKARTSAGNITIAKAAGEVEVHTSGGDIAIGAARAGLVANTSAGDIRITQVQGKVTARTSGGNVEVGEAGAEVNAHTSAGNVKLGEIRGSIQAGTTGGSITIGQAHDSVAAKTAAGDVRVSFAAVPVRTSSVETSGGGITLVLPAGAAVDLDAKANGGTVKSDLPVTATLTESGRNWGELTGKINDGGPKLRLRTSAGNIVIKQAAGKE